MANVDLYKYLVLRRDKCYYVKRLSGSTKRFSETDIIKMLECFIDNIFAMLGGYIFQQTVGILISTNCAPLLADVFLYSYRASQEKRKAAIQIL